MAEPIKLFKFYRDQNAEALKNKRLFFYRVNRWRFDPFDFPRPWRSHNRGFSSILRLRYAVGALIVYRLTLHYVFPPEH